MAAIAAPLLCCPGDARAVSPDVFPFGYDRWVNVQGREQPPDKPNKPVNTIQDVFDAFRACWRGPPANVSRPGTEITIRFSFKRDGSIIGSPRVTFQSELSQEQRLAYFTAVAEALQRCLPLPFTASFGQAVAGHPFALRFIDDRSLKKAEYRQ
jgi:hypothetical protein